MREDREVELQEVDEALLGFKTKCGNVKKEWHAHVDNPPRTAKDLNDFSKTVAIDLKDMLTKVHETEVFKGKLNSLCEFKAAWQTSGTPEVAGQGRRAE